MPRRRMLGAALALTLTVSGAALVSGVQAWAATGPHGKVVCTTITGNVSSTITVSGCSGTANTGTSTQPIPVASLAAGGTITWVNGKTTTISAATIVAKNAKKCPGYVKGAPDSSNPSADKVSGTVNADTTGLKVPGKYKGAVCISPSGDITALKPLKAN